MNRRQQEQLLGLARQGLEAALENEPPSRALEEVSDPALREAGASFVTLYREASLRGCIGSLEAHRPLAEDVMHNALAAAFRDPRFPPLQTAELEAVRIHISVLAPPEPVSFASEEELHNTLRPDTDGVILTAGERRATFLPQVWEQLPEPETFLARLREKAGLPRDYPLARTQIERYTVKEFGE